MTFPSQRVPGYLGTVFLFVWCTALTTALVFSGAWHYAVMAGPAAGEVAAPSSLSHGPGWRMVHVLAADCGCSAAVARRLAARRPQAGVAEHVWMVGDAPDLTTALRTAGFTVEQKGPESLAETMRIEGMPWLLIARGGDVVYSGGYASRNPATAAQLEDVTLLRRLQQGDHPDRLPAFGCATSRRARGAFDPFGLKYTAP